MQGLQECKIADKRSEGGIGVKQCGNCKHINYGYPTFENPIPDPWCIVHNCIIDDKNDCENFEDDGKNENFNKDGE